MRGERFGSLKGLSAYARHIGPMSANLRHRYPPQIRTSRNTARDFTWASRGRGKLFRRFHRPYPSEAQARAAAEAEIEPLRELDVFG